MSIDKEYEELKAWAESQSILIIKGDYKNNSSPIVEFHPSKGITLSNIKDLIKATQTQFLVIDLLQFETETYNNYKSMAESLDNLELLEKFNAIKKYECQLLGFEVMLFKDGMTFIYSKYISEIDNFIDLGKIVEEILEEEDSNYKLLPQEKAEELGKQLAQHENYTKQKTKAQRIDLAIELFQSNFQSLKVHEEYGSRIVVRHAEGYYESKVKPQREKELKAQIQTRLKEGMTKVKIAAELGISKDILNKYV